MDHCDSCDALQAAEYKQSLIPPRFGCRSPGAGSLIRATSVYCGGIKFNFIISC